MTAVIPASTTLHAPSALMSQKAASKVEALGGSGGLLTIPVWIHGVGVRQLALETQVRLVPMHTFGWVGRPAIWDIGLSVTLTKQSRFPSPQRQAQPTPGKCGLSAWLPQVVGPVGSFGPLGNPADTIGVEVVVWVEREGVAGELRSRLIDAIAGAGDGGRTRDPWLGKPMLYH